MVEFVNAFRTRSLFFHHSDNENDDDNDDIRRIHFRDDAREEKNYILNHAFDLNTLVIKC